MLGNLVLHDVTGMALIQRDNWQQYAADLPYNMLGISARATYSYDSRYLAEVNVGYNGSGAVCQGKTIWFLSCFFCWMGGQQRSISEGQ